MADLVPPSSSATFPTAGNANGMPAPEKPVGPATPAGVPITGFGYLSDHNDGQWECQHLAPTTLQLTPEAARLHMCGALLPTARALLEHYHTGHRKIDILIPGYWHPCDVCHSFNEAVDRCSSCLHRTTGADVRWVCGISSSAAPLGAAPGGKAPIMPKIIGLGEDIDGDGGDDYLFACLTEQEYRTLGFDVLEGGTLHPIFRSDGIFTRAFLSVRAVEIHRNG